MVISPVEYLRPIGRGGRNVAVYSWLDGLDIGDSWEIAPYGETERTTHRLQSYWQLMRPGRLVRVHTTSRGFMFLRIE